MSDRFMTGYDRFMTAFEKMTISKKLGKSRLCGYVYDRNDRNDSFFSLLHVRAYIHNSFLFIISIISVIEKEKRRKNLGKSRVFRIAGKKEKLSQIYH